MHVLKAADSSLKPEQNFDAKQNMAWHGFLLLKKKPLKLDENV